MCHVRSLVTLFLALTLSACTQSTREKAQMVVKMVTKKGALPGWGGDAEVAFTFQDKKYKVRYTARSYPKELMYFVAEPGERMTYMRDMDTNGTVDLASRAGFGTANDDIKHLVLVPYSPATGYEYQSFWQSRYSEALQVTIDHAP